MTYLDLVNSVMRRLREPQVTNIYETSYSTLIGDLVNDAKQIVEDSHSWSALRTSIEFDTVKDTPIYGLTGAGQDAEVREAMNTTGQRIMNMSNRSIMNKRYNLTTPAEGSPTEFAFNGTDSNGDITVRVYPRPDAIYTLFFDAFVKQAVMTTGADVLKVPYNPVLQLALGMALRERGETGGQSAMEQFTIAQTSLSDAIAFDANKYEEDTVYTAV
tara:strand:- start:696 stop:1343 length:648 start_codon:yes stop_codon:yes gene_type:complete